MKKRFLGLVLIVAVASGLNAGCRLFGAVATAAVVTAATVAIVSATAPPPARVEYAPVAQPGYVWIRGHWILRGGQWYWQAGHWQAQRAGYAWQPGRWVQLPDGRYQWYPGQWVVVR